MSTLRRVLAAVAATTVALPVGLLPGPAHAAPPSAAFPPGIWKGVAVVTDGISAEGVSAFASVP